MAKKTAIYRNPDGTEKKIEYDPEAPCIYCGYPVEEASVGGTVVCPACDMGVNRFTMAPWSPTEYFAVMKNFRSATDGGTVEEAYPNDSLQSWTSEVEE